MFSILTIINKIEDIFLTSYKSHTLKVTLADRPGIVNDIKKMLIDRKIKKDILRIIRSLDEDGVSSEPLSRRLLK